MVNTEFGVFSIKTILRTQWTAILAGALVFAAFAPTLVELVREWIDRPEYSHGFLMPLVALWLLWTSREEIARTPKRPSVVGVLLLVPCLAVLLLGEMKLSWFLKPYALVGSIGSLIWALAGWRVFRQTVPAMIILLLMCPLPGRVQQGLTMPLKSSAALFATGLLDIAGIEASLEGNMIHLPGLDSLWVADACSGIRSLISLFSLSIMACFVWRAHWMLKLAVVLSSVPIAIFVNAVRIWLTGVLSVMVSPEAAQGFFHDFEGLVIFLVGGLILWGWAFLLGAAFRSEEQEEASAA